MEGDVKSKIFPRNLTAYAARVVRGNPVVSRPESGADNSHPGLEFDQRNLDRGFFPGLLFDFQFGIGARLVEALPMWPDMRVELDKETRRAAQDAAVARDGGFFLWYAFGNFGDQPGKLTLAALYGLDGYEVLRKVHDLESGPLAIVVARHPDQLCLNNREAWMGPVQKLLARFLPVLADKAPPPDVAEPEFVAFRDRNGDIQGAIFIARRSRYLDGYGVIDLATANRGVLTQSLCSPWQWDFADCGCYYWAASRPDIVTGEDETTRLNYLRDRDPTALPAANARTWKEWMKGVMSGAAMIKDWERLPVVINDRESRGTVQLITPLPKDVWERDKVVDELKRLATVEHMLCVKFLYAYYSVNAPKGVPPPNADKKEVARSQVAGEVVKIAIDEMRHFRWVNEALVMLGEQPDFGRASTLRRLEPNVELAQPQVSLRLEGLTPEALQRFIDIERPTTTKDPHEVSSLYTNILLSLQSGRGDFRNEKGEDVREQVGELVKLIIDEGRDHFHRAEYAQKLLKDDNPQDYLRYESAPVPQPSNSEAGRLQRLGNHYYHSVLQILQLAFREQPDARASMLKQTRRIMHNLDDIGHALGSEHGKGLLFAMPRRRPDRRGSGGDSRESLPNPALVTLALGTSIPRILATLKGSPSPQVAEIARRHAQEASDLMHFFAAAGDEGKGR
jgi:hypothetical protein